jgi:hypothetical protein
MDRDIIQPQVCENCGVEQNGGCSCVHFIVYYVNYDIKAGELLKGYWQMTSRDAPNPDEYELASFGDDGFNTIHVESLVSVEQAAKIAIDYSLEKVDKFSRAAYNLRKQFRWGISDESDK